MRFVLQAVAALAALATAVPLNAPHVVHERRDVPHRHWAKRSRVPGHTDLPVRIGMVQNNLDRVEELLMEVSEHDSPRYGQHYTAEEVIDLFAPLKHRVDAVTGWLKSTGISPERIGLSANRQWVSLDMKVSEMEELLRTKYYQFEHKATGKTTVGCDEYHVPAHIQEHIDYITPGLRLAGGQTPKDPSIRKRKLNIGGPLPGHKITTAVLKALEGNEAGMCDSVATPQCIAEMYNITAGTMAHPNNKMGIFEEGDFYDAESLPLFFAAFAPQIPVNTMPVVDGVDGGMAPGAVATGESDLDLQISYPIIYPQNSIIFQTDDLLYSQGVEGKGGIFNTFLDAIDGSYCHSTAFGETGNSKIDPVYPDPDLAGYEGKLQCGVYKPTNVISVSYGEQEDDLPNNYQRRQCLEFAKLGMQGSTVIFASGDSGVSARASDDGNSDGCLGTGAAAGKVFSPDFPASCPYVSALGATFIPTGGDAKKDQEVAVTRFPSGGGFSNVYARPKYQSALVNTYLTAHNPPYTSYSLSTSTNNPTPAQYGSGIYNRAGRGYPDFSAIGDNVIIFLDGTPMLIGGTSAAAPVFGAIINRINEHRLAAGKSTVGFVNPTLYAHPGVMHDITNGSNPGCGTQGFAVTKGWDPVTGIGTPNFPAMLKLFESLP